MKKFVVYIILFYAVSMAGFAQFQEKIIFQPERLEENYKFQFAKQFDEFNLLTDGGSLNALYFTVPNPKGAILYFHGNRGSLTRWGKIASGLTDYGYNVLVMDYRGYGKSRGKISETLLQEDALTFYDKLKTHFSEDSIIVFGRSLGSHFATYVASKNNPAQLILETPFYSMTTVARGKLPFFPVERLINYPFDNSSLINLVRCPITFLHGTSDGVVPYKNGKKLYDIALSNNKTLITIEGGKHNNLIDFPAYKQAIEECLYR